MIVGESKWGVYCDSFEVNSQNCPQRPDGTARWIGLG
jgi:hypothetical protein